MIQATGTRYIVRSIEKEKVTAGGIFVSNTDETQLAEIVSAGTKIQNPLNIGARVILDWASTVPIKHDDQQYYVVDQTAIHAEVL